MFKNALVSVSDKKGLDSFLQPLVQKGMGIVSSGGTARFLREKGFVVKEVSEQTQFPEVMGGRVKTLHPFIHMPLLQRGASHPEDQELLKNYGLEPFDLVVVNLYPFKQNLGGALPDREMVELIDIGGPTLLRAAAKNFNHVTLVCDPEDYEWVGQKAQSQEMDQATRQQLAAKVFSHVSDYDGHIASYLSKGEYQGFQGRLHQDLRYGENPSQKAQWLASSPEGLHQAQRLQGKPLSYNNLLDLEAALQTLRLFREDCAEPLGGHVAVSVKHNNPCGVAKAPTMEEALDQSLKADPVSVFGGIIAFSGELDGPCADHLAKLFLECVIAPSITPEAKARLAEKKNLRVLLWPSMIEPTNGSAPLYRSIEGGLLKQSQDVVASHSKDWQLVSGELTETDWQGLLFAWRVCASLKSNAIAVTSQSQSLGLGMGQVNRVDAVAQALGRMEKFHPDNPNRYLASDAFFPFPDSLELIAQKGIKGVVQPGGSIKDDEVIKKARDHQIPMVLTGVRHFRH